MNIKDLKTLVQQGEGLHLEFKLKATHPEKIVREMVAFANSGGGKLLVGVADDKTIPGVKFPDEEEYILEKAITQLIEPVLPFTLEKVTLPDERGVLVYQINSSELKPHYVKMPESEEFGKAYVRVADRTVQASKEMREVLKGSRKQRNYRFEFGDKEKTLMQYLSDKQQITVNGFSEIAGIPRQTASRTLVLLVLSGVLKIIPDEESDFFEAIA